MNSCNLFKKISKDTWKKVIKFHSVNMNLNEPGYTNDIIVQIRLAAKNNKNIGVWANNGFKEIDFGSDIDIFVEIEKNKYIWWALQAKVLKKDGKYYGMSTIRGGESQWDKLHKLQKKAGCIVRYLLYNGVYGYTMKHFGCAGLCYEDQFGCSLVSLARVAASSSNRYPGFFDFHPVHAEPWHVITCCYTHTDMQGLTYYSPEQIKKSISHYPNADRMSLPEDMLSDSGNSLNMLGINAIEELSKEAGRKVVARVVYRKRRSN